MSKTKILDTDGYYNVGDITFITTDISIVRLGGHIVCLLGFVPGIKDAYDYTKPIKLVEARRDDTWIFWSLTSNKMGQLATHCFDVFIVKDFNALRERGYKI